MEKIQYIILCLLTGLSTASCGGFLDENPADQLEEDEAYSTAQGVYLNAVASLYSYVGGYEDSQGLSGTYRGVYDLNTFTTDEAMLPTRGGDWYDGGYWQRLFLHTWTVSDYTLKDTWDYLYKVVVLCNRSLERLSEASSAGVLTSSAAASYSAEVRSLRAMYYFYLLDMFGRVPLVVSADTRMSEVSQSSRSEVFRFVVSELQENAPSLPLERSNYEGEYYGRVTRPVAWFLLCKVLLNAGVYSDDDWTDSLSADPSDVTVRVNGHDVNALEACVAYADSLESFGCSLESSYSAPFSVHNETSVENIFTIPMDKTLYTNQYQYLFRSRHYSHGSAYGYSAENGSCATLEALAANGYGTSEVDPRFDANYFYGQVYDLSGNVVSLDTGEPLVYYPSEVKLDLSGSEYEKTAGARMKKYEVDPTGTKDGKLFGNDIVLYRYSDVLLMKAEALLRLGRDGSEPFDEVRSRAGATVKTLTEDGLLEERMIELAWEGWRRNDLVRFGRFTREYSDRPQCAGESSGFTTVFPIPADVLTMNPKLSQNPGY